MTPSRIQTRRTIAAAFTLALAQAAQATLLPLQAGTYVVAGYSPCRDAPLAGVLQFDGDAFLGPHESDCHSVVLQHDGSSYQVETECRALGDGTPSTPSRQTTTVQVESPTRLLLTRGDKATEYALCPQWR